MQTVNGHLKQEAKDENGGIRSDWTKQWVIVSVRYRPMTQNGP